MTPASGSKRRRPVDPARRVAFDALRTVHAEDAYANLVIAKLLGDRHLHGRDAAFATELFAGTCRAEGTYDAIIAAAAGRELRTLQPAVVDVLRLGAHQLLAMRVPTHAAVAASVDLAAGAIGERVTGLVNAVLRRVAARDLDDWVEQLSVGLDPLAAQALRTSHPAWICTAYGALLGAEAETALAADNIPPVTTLVARPGLTTVDELRAAGADAGRWSPYAATYDGNPGDLDAIRTGRAGVQDEGSQLVALALAAVEAPDGPWLDLCAGPGGKAALLAGLATEQGSRLVANELAPHRAELVRQSLRGYPDAEVVVGDGTAPEWPARSFARVLADVPCSGLGALRRRPESRWRRTPADVDQLHPLQQALLRSALDSCVTGGVVAYVTCSPHRHETVDVVEAVLADRGGVEVLDASSSLPAMPAAALGPYAQLWPHRHGTDAMFLAILRVSA